MRYIVFILWLLLGSVPASAQLYKWVDKHGNTQYSDQPPRSNNTQNEQLKIRSAPKPSPTNDTENPENTDKPETLADQRLDYDKRRQERLEKASQLKAEIEENQQKCIDAKSRLRVFLESPRLRMPDGKGGLVYVDDKIRQQKIDEANKAVKSFCK